MTKRTLREIAIDITYFASRSYGAERRAAIHSLAAEVLAWDRPQEPTALPHFMEAVRAKLSAKTATLPDIYKAIDDLRFECRSANEYCAKAECLAEERDTYAKAVGQYLRRNKRNRNRAAKDIKHLRKQRATLTGRVRAAESQSDRFRRALKEFANEMIVIGAGNEVFKGIALLRRMSQEMAELAATPSAETELHCTECHQNIGQEHYGQRTDKHDPDETVCPACFARWAHAVGDFSDAAPEEDETGVHKDDCVLSDPETFANPATRGLGCSCGASIKGTK